MKRVIAAMTLAIDLTSFGQLKHESASHVVLPSSELIGCKVSGCSSVWLVDAADSQALYPRNISIDIDDEGVLGVVARYDKSTAIDDIRASINKRYGEWVFPKDHAGPASLWRVEREKVAIQLSEHDDGTKEVIYLSARAWLVRGGKAKP
jgi:hypothetical protein